MRAMPAAGNGHLGRQHVLSAVMLLLLLLFIPLAAFSAMSALAKEAPRLSGVRVQPLEMASTEGVEVVVEVSSAISFDAGVQVSPLRLEMVVPGLQPVAGGRTLVEGKSPLVEKVQMRSVRGGMVLAVRLRKPALIVDAHAERGQQGRPARLVVRLARTDAATLARMLEVPVTALERHDAADNGAGDGGAGKNVHRYRGGNADDGALSRVKAAYRKLVEEAAAKPLDIGELINALPLGFGGGKDQEQRKRQREKDDMPARRLAIGRGKGDGEKGDDASRSPVAARAGKDGGVVIVVDAGHGGKDPGAIGPRGVKEKDIVLKFARTLRAALERRGYKVVMTRDGDTYLKLRQRVQVARAHHAALFVSIHADKFRRRGVGGLGIYTLSERASDADAAALAKMENAADLIGAPEDELDDNEVRDILVDLTQRETNANSHLLATRLVQSLRQVVPLRRNPVRSAAFRVLRAPEIPSLLIELGYITNPRDVRNMLSRAWRRRAAERMAATMDKLLKERLALR